MKYWTCAIPLSSVSVLPMLPPCSSLNSCLGCQLYYHSIARFAHRVWFYPWFPASIGGPGMYPLQTWGTTVVSQRIHVFVFNCRRSLRHFPERRHHCKSPRVHSVSWSRAPHQLCAEPLSTHQPPPPPAQASWDGVASSGSHTHSPLPLGCNCYKSSCRRGTQPSLQTSHCRLPSSPSQQLREA